MSDTGMKRNHFHQANLRLAEGIALYKPNDDLQRDGLIQRFEFTFELAWKTLKDLFYREGLTGLTMCHHKRCCFNFHAPSSSKYCRSANEMVS